MDTKLHDYVSKKAKVLFANLPLDIEDETLTIRDSYHRQQRKYIKYQINVCEEILKLNPEDAKVKKWKNEYKSKLQLIDKSFPLPTTDFTKLTISINNAFFRVESFINGTLKQYDYFGFFDAFMVLFEEGKKPKNWLIENCKLIDHYWILIQQIDHDVYNSGYAVDGVLELPQFEADIQELMALSSNFLDEFLEFTTQDERDTYNRRVSILDDWKPERIEHRINSSYLSPTFKEDAITEIISILKPFLSFEDIIKFKDLIEGKAISQPVLFQGNANVLCDFFKQLLSGRFLIIGIQKHLEAWIQRNFLYTDLSGDPTELKLKYISDFISGNKRPSKKKRLIDVGNEAGKNIIIQVLRTKTTTTYK